MERALPMLPLACVFAACGGDPLSVRGNYTVNVTNGENDCDVMDWMEGETTTGIPLVVRQDGDQVDLDVQGVIGGALDLFHGDSTFNGQVEGNRVTAALIGSRSYRQGMCSYTYTVDLEATVMGDFMDGTLTWRPVTNGHADCGILETCRNTQRFNGSRPPEE